MKTRDLESIYNQIYNWLDPLRFYIWDETFEILISKNSQCIYIGI